MEEKLKELLSNEEYVKELVALRTPEKIKESLGNNGVELSVEEIQTVISLAKKKVNGELTDEELEEIAGGSIIGYLIGIAVTGIAIGSCGTALAFLSC